MEKKELGFNIKAIMMFEKLSGASFFDINEDNYIFILYTMYLVNHPTSSIPIDSFFNILNANKKLSKKIVSEFESYMKYIEQYREIKKDDEIKENTEVKENPKITDMVMYLIVYCGIDPHYVMYEMDLWEIELYYKAIEGKKKEDMELARFWTYINISPHIDTKKCKSPDKLVPFAWEKEERKNKQIKELENNRFAINNMIGKNIFGESEENTNKDG